VFYGFIGYDVIKIPLSFNDAVRVELWLPPSMGKGFYAQKEGKHQKTKLKPLHKKRGK
jgi:hypothetical protein